MAVYNTGFVSLYCGTNMVKGTGTDFVAGGVTPGQFLTVPGLPAVYQIQEVQDSLTLYVRQNFPGPAGNIVGNLSYFIPADFSPVLSLPLPGPDMLGPQIIYNRALEILDGEIPPGM